MNLQIESYLVKSKNFTFNKLTNNDELFVNINNYQSIDKKLLDYDYLSGALIIKYEGKELLGFKHWDLIDQLWYYFVDAFIKLASDGKAEFSFPDQPFKVMMERKNNTFISLNLNGNVFLLNEKDFITQMLISSNNFFMNLKKIFPEYEFDIDECIDKVKQAEKIY